MPDVDLFGSFKKQAPQETGQVDLFSEFKTAAPIAVGGSLDNTDQAVNALSLSKRAGVAPSVAMADPEGVKIDADAAEAGEASKVPEIAKYLSELPFAAAVSKGDYRNLTWIANNGKGLDAPKLFNYTWDAVKRNFQTPLGIPIEEGVKYPNAYKWLQPLAAPLDFVLRSFTALEQGIGAAGGEILRQHGASEASARSLERELTRLTESVDIVAAGGLFPHTLNRLAKTATAAREAEAAEAAKLTPEQRATGEAAMVPRPRGQQATVEVTPLTPEARLEIEQGRIPRPGLDPLIDTIHEKQVQLDQLNMDQLFERVQGSLTRERSPDMMAGYLKGVTGDQVVYLPADKVLELYQARQGEAVTFGSAKDGVFGYVPDLLKQVENALETGGDVAIPLSEFLARTDPKVYAEVKDSLRMRRDGPTKEELAEAKSRQTQQEEFAAEVKAVEEAGAVEPPVPEGMVRVYHGGQALGEGETGRWVSTNRQYASDYNGPGVPLHYMDLPETDPRVMNVDIPEQGVKQGFTFNFALTPEETMKLQQVKRAKAETKAEAAQESPDQYIIEAEKRSLYLDRAFENGKALGLTEAEFAKYSKRIEAADAATAEKVAAAAEREAKRRLSPEWKDNARELEAEVRTDLASRPDLAADNYLREGVLPTGERTGRVYLDRGVVEAQLGEGRLRAYTKEGGLLPDEVAELMNYRSGQQMLKELDLLALARENLKETPKAYLERVVAQEVEIRMEQKYGSLEQAVAEAAREAALSAERLDILASELKGIAEAAKADPPYTREFLENHAAERFESLPTRQISYEAFRRDTERAGRNAEKALLSGKFDEAFKWKQRQFLSFLYAKEARTFAKEVARGDRLIDRLKEKSVKGIDPAYMDQIHGILERIGERTKRNREELATGLAGKDLQTFAETVADNGWELSIPEFLLNPLAARTKDQLTAAEYRGFQEALRTLAHVGKESQFIISAGKKVLFEEVKADIVKNMMSLPKRMDLAKPDSTGKRRLGFDSTIAKMETLSEDFDLGDVFGPFTQHIFRPAKESQLRESAMLDDIAKQLNKIGGDKGFRKGLEEKIDQDFFIDPETGTPFNLTRSHMLFIAANFGNRSNIRKFVGGWVGKDAPPMDTAVLEHKFRNFLNQNMRKSDWDFVQGVWDIFDGLKGQADTMYRELSGIGMVPVKAEVLTTPHGAYNGGYFPIIYDWKRSNIDIIKEGSVHEKDFVRATSPNGYMKARAEGFVQPIMFQNTTEYFIARLKQEVHDIASRRAVIDAQKIISDPEIRHAIRWHYGPEYEKQLTPWLKDFANKQNIDQAGLAEVNSLMAKVRGNLMINALGLNMNVIFSPGTGKLIYSPTYWKTAAQLGYDKVAAKLQRHPSMAEEMWQKSPELRQTTANLDRDFRDQLEVLAVKGKWDAMQKKAAYVAMQPASWMEVRMRTVTFTAEYQRALRDGLEEADAVYKAEREVRRMHGATSKVDLSALFRSDNAWLRTFTMFQTYLNTLYNWQREIPRHVRSGDYASAMGVLTGSFIVPSLFSAALFTEKKPDESYGAFAARAVALQAASTIPFLNSATQMLLEGHRPKDPITGLVSTVWAAFRDSAAYTSGNRVSDNWLRNTLNAGGLAFGLPLGQVAKTSQFLNDVRRRKQNPKNFQEWLHGLRTGRAREK